MQGQKSAIDPSPETITLEHGSSSSEPGLVDQQIYWTNFIQNLPANPNQETQNLSMWSLGESSSTSLTNQASQNRVDPPASMLSLGHNVTVNPSTFIGIKPANYASSSSSGPLEMEARQLPCKRKETEFTVSQSSSSIVNPAQLNASDPVFSNTRAAETNRRNVRIRINNPREQDLLPASDNDSNSNNNRQLNFSSPYPTLGLNSVGEGSSSHGGRFTLRVPALRRNLQVTSRSRSSSSRANRPVSSSIVGGSGDNSRTMPTNISDHPLFAPPHATQTALNRNLNPGVVNENGYPVGNTGPHHDSSIYPSRRLSEILRRSLLSSVDSGGGGGAAAAVGGWSSDPFSRIPPPIGSLASSSSQESAIPNVVGVAGHHHPRQPLPHLTPPERPFDVAFGFPPHLARSMAGGSERRGRLASEIRNVLDLIRRGEGLRFEDVMILDQSMFYGMGGIHDRHRDMRLDIDNMSYEELLALEERIGNVNTGLTEEKVSKCLKQRTFEGEKEHPDAEPCCICQDEYKNGDELGSLECGHDFHTTCIKQWLLQKNSCPVCKSTASK